MKRFSLLLLPVALMAQPAAPTTTTAPTTPADPLDALAADSPFLPANGSPRGATATSTGPLELRSIVFVDGAYRFSIYDQGTQKAEWVAIGEKGYPFIARSFNRERDTLSVEHQGRAFTLALQPARMAASGTAPAPSPTPLPGPGQPGPNNPASRKPQAAPATGPGGVPLPAANAPNAAEAQRLQNLADEIRRRRGNGSRFTLPQSQPQKKN